jgi:hypothetical protein
MLEAEIRRPNDPVVVLELTDDGDWTYKWGQSRDSVSVAGRGYGTYEVDDDTVTWLGGECDSGVEGVYTYTLGSVDDCEFPHATSATSPTRR